MKNVSFKNNLNSESVRAYNEIKEQNKKINYTKLVYNGSGKLHYNFTVYLNLGSFAGSIYIGSLLRKAAKIKRKDMENILRKLDEYSPKKEKYKALKISTLLNAR